MKKRSIDQAKTLFLLVSAVAVNGCQDISTPNQNNAMNSSASADGMDKIQTSVANGIKADLKALNQFASGYAQDLSSSAANHAQAAQMRMSERLQAMEGDPLYDQTMVGGAALRAKWSREEIIQRDAQQAAIDTKNAIEASKSLSNQLVMNDNDEQNLAKVVDQFWLTDKKLDSALIAGKKLGKDAPTGSGDLKLQLNRLRIRFEEHIKAYNAKAKPNERIAVAG